MQVLAVILFAGLIGVQSQTYLNELHYPYDSQCGGLPDWNRVYTNAFCDPGFDDTQ